MRIFILLVFVLKLNSAFAQGQPGVFNYTDSAKQVRGFLAGFWQEDSASNKIEFRSAGNDLRLIRPGSYVYDFFWTNAFPLDGVSITWPPHGCEVKKISNDHIEVVYTPFGGKPVPVKYKRVDSLQAVPLVQASKENRI